MSDVIDGLDARRPLSRYGQVLFSRPAPLPRPHDSGPTWGPDAVAPIVVWWVSSTFVGVTRSDSAVLCIFVWIRVFCRLHIHVDVGFVGDR
mgnify:CR=1 FL=1